MIFSIKRAASLLAFVVAAYACCTTHEAQAQTWVLEKDVQKTIKVMSGNNVERWVHAIRAGKEAEAEKVYAEILQELNDVESSSILVNRLSLRIEMENLVQTNKQIDTLHLLEHLHDATNKALGENHRFMEGPCLYLGRYFEGLKKYGEAEKYRREQLRACQKSLGDKSVYTAHAYFNLATVLRRQKKYHDAEPYLKRAMKVYEGLGYAPGVENVQATILDNLKKEHRLAEANQLSQKWLSLRPHYVSKIKIFEH